MQPKPTLDEILDRLHATEQELEQELDRLLAEKRKQFNIDCGVARWYSNVVCTTI